MRASRLVGRSLLYYWRTNAAVVVGVAVAVAVLAGALLVGDSVRGSLRDLVEERLGAADIAIVAPNFFREQLAADMAANGAFAEDFVAAAPLITVTAVVTAQESGRRASRVVVYGVDERFWTFHGVSPPAALGDRDALVNGPLAAEIGADAGTAILVRVQRPSDVPLESLHGRKDDAGRTLRLTVRGSAAGTPVGQFSLDPRQSEVLAVFVPLSRLQQELEVGDRVNTALVAARDDRRDVAASRIDPIVRSVATLEDVGLKIRTTTEGKALIVESDAGVISDEQAATVQRALTAAGMPTRAVLTYLANSMKHGDREVPYSLVSAIGVTSLRSPAPPLNLGTPSIILNQWAATELAAKLGDRITMDYYVWEDPGRLVTRTSEFRVGSVVPIETGDRDLATTYPGITDAASLSDWDPPFPVDLRRVRPVDEEYWDRYRTTPKAFIALDAGQRLWRSRYGAITSIRVAAEPDTFEAARAQVAQRLRAAIDPIAFGLTVRNLRADGVSASRGAIDFGEYFVYFSFFLVVSALVLAVLFFKLGIEQRVREVGLLRAVGLGPREVRRMFLAEGVLLAVVGSALGTVLAVGYAAALMAGLRSWWVDAVGTTALTLHVTPSSLIAGAGGGVLAAAACIWWTLRSLARVSERSLLAGSTQSVDAAGSGLGTPTDARRQLYVALALATLGVGLIAAGAARAIPAEGAFFGAGAAFLGAALFGCAFALKRRPRSALQGFGWWPVSRLGLRNASYRPGRSVLSMSVVASATFILIAVGAFRRDGVEATDDRQTGTGGYALMVESVVPVVHDPNTPAGRDALNLFDLDESVVFEPFRVLPGDDASCLNLYEPRNPRILAPRPSFLAAGRFAFQRSMASGGEEAANPWLLLNRSEPDGAIPVIGDANSMTYVLHRAVGEDFVITRNGSPVTLRFVAALQDSIFQSELLMSEANFLKLFPEQEGFQVLLVERGRMERGALQSALESALGDLGADATGTAERLATYHRVENTYLTTFQTLGGLGLLIGTVGVGAVLIRNVLERRRDVALLRAVGYGRRHLVLMAVAENTAIVASGLLVGAVSAGLAIAPAVVDRGGRLPLSSGVALLLFGVFVVALLSSIAAMAAATRAPLLESLRSE